MFVLMAILAVWLSWELREIERRKAYLAGVYYGRWDPRWHGYRGDDPKFFGLTAPSVADYATIPFWRCLLGDEPVDFIVLGVGSPVEDVRVARNLIPEARIYRQATGGAVLEKSAGFKVSRTNAPPGP